MSRKESETFSSSWVLRYLAAFTLIPLLVARPAVQGVQQDVGGGELTGTWQEGQTGLGRGSQLVLEERLPGS